MNAKMVGQAVRRGVVIGALAGFVAGWGAFAASSRPSQSVADAAATSDDRISTAVAQEVPPVPKPPTLGPIPTPIAVQASSLKTSAPPPALPTLQPLPPLPNVQVAVHTTTRTS